MEELLNEPAPLIWRPPLLRAQGRSIGDVNAWVKPPCWRSASWAQRAARLEHAAPPTKCRESQPREARGASCGATKTALRLSTLPRLLQAEEVARAHRDLGGRRRARGRRRCGQRLRVARRGEHLVRVGLGLGLGIEGLGVRLGLGLGLGVGVRVEAWVGTRVAASTSSR